ARDRGRGADGHGNVDGSGNSCPRPRPGPNRPFPARARTVSLPAPAAAPVRRGDATQPSTSGGSRPVFFIATLMTAQMAAASPQAVEGRGRPEFTAPRLESAAVVVDGRLDEPAWGEALRLTGFSQLEPVAGPPAPA